MKKECAVLTRNVYVNIAVMNLLNVYHGPKKILIVDLSSYCSLKTLMNEMCSAGLNSSHEIVLLGDCNIFSCLFSPLGVVERDWTVELINSYLYRKSGISARIFEKFVESRMFVTELSEKQIMIAMLHAQYSIRTIADIMGLPVKTIYQYASCSIKLMNLKSFAHLSFYMSNEFSYDNYLSYLIRKRKVKNGVHWLSKLNE